MSKKIFFTAIATLVGTIIGAGILGLPYVISKAGLLTGIIDIFILGTVIAIVYLYLGEVVLRTKGFHQLTGYADKYLGPWGRRLMTFVMTFTLYGALVAYIIGVGSVLSTIFGSSPILFSILFFIIVSAIIYLGIKKVGESELWMMIITSGVILALLLLSLPFISLDNLSGFNIAKIFIPYGVIIFAFHGGIAVPEMREILVNNEKLLKHAILIGVLIPIFAYLIFAIVIVGVTGLATTEVATIGLGNTIGTYILVIGNLLAVLTMATSFLTSGLALQEMYNYDYKLNHLLSWALTCFVALGIALLKFTTFINVIAITGIFAGGLEGILIILMAFKAKKLGNRKPEYSIKLNKWIAVLLIAIFILGAVFYFKPL